MDIRMSDNPLDRLSAFNRVSIRAVLVHDGEDPSAALAEAGIFDPVAIPVVLGDETDLGGGVLGDGITANLTGVLETEQEDDFDSSPFNQPDNQPGLRPEAAQRGEPVTTTLPAAFGLQPLAPVHRLGDTGQSPDSDTGRYGYRARIDPPTPSRFV
jgi:hypothetical protein